MLKNFLAVIAVVIAGVLIYAYFQRNEYIISRELLIKATPTVLFPYINSIKKADEWMPWTETDLSVKTMYVGPDVGIGAKSGWESEGSMGTGQAHIIESKRDTFVNIQLTYAKPRVMSQLVELKLTPVAEGTIVSWSVRGRNTFLDRVISIFIDIDKVVGSQFEKGLAKLKQLVEEPVKELSEKGEDLIPVKPVKKNINKAKEEVKKVTDSVDAE